MIQSKNGVIITDNHIRSTDHEWVAQMAVSGIPNWELAKLAARCFGVETRMSLIVFTMGKQSAKLPATIEEYEAAAPFLGFFFNDGIDCPTSENAGSFADVIRIATASPLLAFACCPLKNAGLALEFGDRDIVVLYKESRDAT